MTYRAYSETELDEINPSIPLTPQKTFAKMLNTWYTSNSLRMFPRLVMRTSGFLGLRPPDT